MHVDGPLGIDGRIRMEDFTCPAAVVLREVDPDEMYAAKHATP